MKEKVAFIGLGVMGYPMAGHLSDAGHDVTVYNRTTSKAQCWIDTYRGKLAQTPAKATMDSDIVLLCVGNDADLRSVMLGDDGVLSSLRPGSIWLITPPLLLMSRPKCIWLARISALCF